MHDLTASFKGAKNSFKNHGNNALLLLLIHHMEKALVCRSLVVTFAC